MVKSCSFVLHTNAFHGRVRTINETPSLDNGKISRFVDFTDDINYYYYFCKQPREKFWRQIYLILAAH